MPEKGCRIIRITMQEFLRIFRAPSDLENQGGLPYTYRITRFDLPPDARAIAAQFDLTHNGFLVKIESAEFSANEGKLLEIKPKIILLSGKTINKEG